jgi:nucleoside-diphosphate-sugar epimerase
MTNRTVLVLGAQGRFGQAAVEAFAAAGWRVLAQARRAPPALPAGAVHLGVALDDARGVAAAAAGAQVVVYAVNPVYTQWSSHLLPLARQGFAVAERLGALLMLPGNVYGYGEAMPQSLDEDTPMRPGNEKGRLRVQLEDELRERTQRGRMKGVVIRAGDFYGAGKGSWLDLAIVKSLHAGKLVYPGPLDVVHAWAYLPDLARAFVAVAQRAEAPAFESLHFAGHALTGRELLAEVEAAAADLGLRPAAGWRRAGMPWAAMRVGGWFVPMLREVVSMSYLWRVPHALCGRRFERRIGALPQTPPRQALRDALLALGFGQSPVHDARAT